MRGIKGLRGHFARGISSGEFQFLAIAVLFMLATLSHYTLLHTFAEIFSIVVACAIFMFAWNSRRYFDNDYILFLGVASLFVAVFDSLHLLTYKGMVLASEEGSNLPTQLWIAARYLQSISMLAAVLFIKRRMKAYTAIAAYACLSAAVLASIFLFHVFPVCYIEGVGLTIFKKASEFIISSIFVLSALLLYRSGKKFDRTVLRYLLLSLAFMILSELFFTLYLDVYGILNGLGHLFKIVAFYLVYKAIIHTGLTNPYKVILRDLKASEASLREYAAELKSANSLRELFTDILGHDLLNYANIIINKADLIQTRDTKTRESLDTIRSNAKKLADLVAKARLYAKLETTEGFDMHRMELNHMLSKAIDTFRFEAEQKGISVSLLNKGVFFVRANDLLENVFANLISNAIKYSPHGGRVEIIIRDSKDSCIVSVKDWGEGIPNEEKARLFTRFHRFSSTSQGSGLGLAIVKRLVDLHNGRVWVEDNSEGGSVFIVSLPKAGAEALAGKPVALATG